MSMSVRLSVWPLAYLRNHTANFAEFLCVLRACGRDSFLLCRRCDTLCTSGSVDDALWCVVCIPQLYKISRYTSWTLAGRSLISTITLLPLCGSTCWFDCCWWCGRGFKERSHHSSHLISSHLNRYLSSDKMRWAMWTLPDVFQALNVRSHRMHAVRCRCERTFSLRVRRLRNISVESINYCNLKSTKQRRFRRSLTDESIGIDNEGTDRPPTKYLF